MKRRILQIVSVVSVCVAALCTPFSVQAAINSEAFDKVMYYTDDYGTVCPDLHYILDDTLPYQTLLCGNNHIVKSRSASYWYNFTDYDLLFIQTSSQPKAMNGVSYNLVLSDDKVFSIYGCNFGDKEWTQLVESGVAQYGFYVTSNSSEDWANCLLGANYDVYASRNRQNTEYQNYMWYSDLSNSRFSTIDYNGKISFTNIYLTYLKSIGHIFVLKFLKPLIDYIVSEPFFLIIVLFGFSISVLSFIYSIYILFRNKKKIKVRRKR